jgi:hypothetical protein
MAQPMSKLDANVWRMPWGVMAFAPAAIAGRGYHFDNWILDEPNGMGITGLLAWHHLGHQRQAPTERHNL